MHRNEMHQVYTGHVEPVIHMVGNLQMERVYMWCVIRTRGHPVTPRGRVCRVGDVRAREARRSTSM
jgi:hypothetical protein